MCLKRFVNVALSASFFFCQKFNPIKDFCSCFYGSWVDEEIHYTWEADCKYPCFKIALKNSPSIRLELCMCFFFSHHCDKTPGRKNERREGIIWSHIVHHRRKNTVLGEAIPVSWEQVVLGNREQRWEAKADLIIRAPQLGTNRLQLVPMSQRSHISQSTNTSWDQVLNYRSLWMFYIWT